MGQQRVAFQSAILPSLAIPLVSLLIGTGVGIGVVLLLYGPDVDWTAGFVRLLWIVLVSVLIVLATVALFRVYVSEEGLRCYTFWGNYHTLGWPEIDTVRPINLLGLRYIRVGSSRGATTVRVPLFLADMPRFRAAVRELAGEDHILSKALT